MHAGIKEIVFFPGFPGVHGTRSGNSSSGIDESGGAGKPEWPGMHMPVRPVRKAARQKNPAPPRQRTAAALLAQQAQ